MVSFIGVIDQGAHSVFKFSKSKARPAMVEPKRGAVSIAWNGFHHLKNFVIIFDGGSYGFFEDFSFFFFTLFDEIAERYGGSSIEVIGVEHQYGDSILQI